MQVLFFLIIAITKRINDVISTKINGNFDYQRKTSWQNLPNCCLTKKQSKLTLDYKDRSFYVQNISYERNVLCGKKQIVLRIAVCSYESYSGRVTKWKPDKFSQETGFESMTSVILVKWMVHKTKIHNWSELMIPGLYLLSNL